MVQRAFKKDKSSVDESLQLNVVVFLGQVIHPKPIS